MRQPLSFIDPKFPKPVCKLNKAIYDLKQAPRAWSHRDSVVFSSPMVFTVVMLILSCLYFTLVPIKLFCYCTRMTLFS